MPENKQMTIEEFQKRYEVNPQVFIEIQKYGTIMFHPNYEDLLEILFYDFKIDGINKIVSFKEIIGTQNENPFFKIYEVREQAFTKLINYNPYKKDTSVIEADNKENDV